MFPFELFFSEGHIQCYQSSGGVQAIFIDVV
jgi:hypothetical protein